MRKLFTKLVSTVLTLAMSASAFATTYTASVDFAQKDTNNTKRANLVGFLGQFGSGISDTALTPLHPAVLRINVEDTTGFNRAVAIGAKVILVISDGYGYPLNSWNSHGAPYNGNTAWETYVAAKATAYAGQSKNILAWQIWNEPDTQSWNVTQFWDGTQAQFYDVWARGANTLRANLGNSTPIIGPSYANYDNTALTGFLSYIKTNNLRLDFLDWHELSNVDTDPSQIAAHHSTMRSTVASTYPRVGIKKYANTETVGPTLDLKPAGVWNTLYWLENGLVDYAVKSCWNDSSSSNNCFNNSLDGVVDKATGSAPRANWWAYKYYADILRTRVLTTSSNTNLVVMAGRSPARIGIGYVGSTTPVDVTLTIKNPQQLIGVTRTTLTVVITKLTNSGETIVSAPTTVSTQTLSITNGVATVTLSAINQYELYIVQVRP